MNNINVCFGGRGYGKALNIMKRYEEAKEIFNIRNNWQKGIDVK